MKAKKLPNFDLLNKLFAYDKETGVVTRKCSVSRNTKVGDVVGALSSTGYMKVTVQYKSYPLSRVIFKLVTGDDPKGEMDHINRDRTDNRFSNLRDVSSQVNQLNRSGKGYTVIKNGRYRATLHGKDIGYFNCPTAATVAYLKTKETYIAGIK